MLHSNFCILNNKKPHELSSYGESSDERGGYFIIKGKEKVILSQEDSTNNLIYTRFDNISGDYIASIESVYESNSPEK